ncbi:MAG: leucine-rich repeat domain-containing protein [Eubacteriales bacterium]|nr:leucine-rich repeat domain-containing protein [Eubacteriales bacterium]
MGKKIDIEIIFSDQKGAAEARKIAEKMIYVFYMSGCRYLPFDNTGLVNYDGWSHYPERNEKRERIQSFQNLCEDYLGEHRILLLKTWLDDLRRQLFVKAKEVTEQIRLDGARFVFSDCTGIRHDRSIETMYYVDFFSMLCFMLAALYPEITFEGMRRIVDPGTRYGNRILTHAVYDKSALVFEQMEGDPAYGFTIVSWTRAEDMFEKHVRRFPFIRVDILTDDLAAVEQDEDLREWIRGVNDVQMEMAAAELCFIKAFPNPRSYVMLHASSREMCVKHRDELLALLAGRGYQAKTFSILYEDEFLESGMVIPGSVTRIGDRLFSNKRGLQKIVLPDNITEIGEMAFEYCSSLKEAVIPDSVTKIDNYAFYCCANLKTVTLSRKLETVSTGMFCGCPSLENVLLPESVTVIETYAFSGCKSLKSMIIPAGVRKIEKEAFHGCGSLKMIEIPDCVAEFGEGIFKDCSPGLVIRGKKGSEAERYAGENGIAFEADS